MICPCCRQAAAGRLDPRRLLEYLPVTGQQRIILTVLVRRFGRWVTTPWLYHELYGPRIDGGPPLGSVKQQMTALRKKLAPHNFRIDSDFGAYALRWDIDAGRDTS